MTYAVAESSPVLSAHGRLNGRKKQDRGLWFAADVPFQQFPQSRQQGVVLVGCTYPALEQAQQFYKPKQLESVQQIKAAKRQQSVLPLPKISAIYQILSRW